MAFNLKKIFTLRSQIIKMVMILLIILGVVNVLVYNTLAELNSIRRIKESVDLACRQIGISYEATLSYMVETVNKIAIFDFINYDIVTESEKLYEFQISMNRELSSIVSMNSYIISAYIYLVEPDRVFDSRPSSPFRITSLKNFSDRDIFTDVQSHYKRFSGPRILGDGSYPKNAHSVITLVVPIFFRNSSNAYLAVNINADTLYNTIFKNFNMDRDFTFYAYNADNTVIIHSGNKNRLYSILDMETLLARESDLFYYFYRDRPIAAAYASSYLDWTFVLAMQAKPVIHDLPGYIVINLFIIFIVLGIISFVVFVKAGQVSQVALAVSEALWKEVLIDRVQIDEEVQQQLSGGGFLIDGGGVYGVIGICGDYTASSLLKPVCEKISLKLAGENRVFKIIPISKTTVALVIKYRTGDASPDIQRNTAQGLLEYLSPEEQQVVFFAISGLQKNFALLPLCFRQCEDTFKYKLCLESHILDHSLIRDAGREYEFPAELARYLNNNIAAGSKSGCAVYLEKIFGPIERKNVIVSDEQIVNLVIFLQNGAFNAVSDIPGLVKIDTGAAINAENFGRQSLSDIKASLLSFYEKICDEVNALRENQERHLFMAVLEHIEKNCLKDHLISLTSVADDFRISKNHVSGIVKEATGLDFPEYVNQKRIAHAKELLLNNDMTIDEIARAAGYKYSYYFIKIFKSFEGITPGQYRAARRSQETDG
ncbi:MAG: AraC family transcriptional regulator [Treponema sp.]|jgi:AraC-like DNA-binding protein|nr:AraC family transcriptional regulator [Treponema sp.]